MIKQMRFIVVLSALLSCAGASQAEGRYQAIPVGDNAFVYIVIDTLLGLSRMCRWQSIDEAPVCSPWSEE